MEIINQIELPLDLAEKCVKCGLCKSVCPTYPYILEESGYARGRLALAEMVIKGELPLNKEVAKQWNECAMCRRCEWICPNDVEYKKILTEARKLQEEKQGKDFIKDTSLIALNFIQSDAGRKLIKFTGKFLSMFSMEELKIKLPGGPVKFFPKPSSKPFEIRGKTFKAKNEKGTLLFFTGCMIDVFYGDTGKNVIKLMNKIGYTVIVPENIKCCGAPHLYSGNKEAFEKLKIHNEKEIGKYKFDFVVVACPTCGGALEEDYGIENPVFDFAQLLEKENIIFKGKGENVTYHVPCHSYSAMKVDEEVFYNTIGKVENANLIKAEKAKSCCGFAGLFSIKNPELSEKIQREKMEDLEKTKADFILTSCPGCVLQLRDGVNKRKSNQKVKHLADYLAERLTSVSAPEE